MNTSDEETWLAGNTIAYATLLLHKWMAITSTTLDGLEIDRGFWNWRMCSICRPITCDRKRGDCIVIVTAIKVDSRYAKNWCPSRYIYQAVASPKTNEESAIWMQAKKYVWRPHCLAFFVWWIIGIYEPTDMNNCLVVIACSESLANEMRVDVDLPHRNDVSCGRMQLILTGV